MNLDETKELGWDWRRWQWGQTRGSTTIHYANLTRGVKCAPATAKVCRIQSTQCEANAYDRVLLSVPDELIALVALGQFVVVHDYSEKPRETRAMWQGLTLARMMMELRWFGELRARYHTSRGNNSALQHLKNVASQQPEHVRRKYDYFRDLLEVNETTYASLVSCRAGSGKAEFCGYGRDDSRDPSADRPPSNLW